jgi:hypothetical protein
MSALTYSSGSIVFYQYTAVIGALLAAMIFAGRYLSFRGVVQPLKEKGRLTFEKGYKPESDRIKNLAYVGVLIAIVLPILSIRFMDPQVWLAALLGYISGVNSGELSYYLFVRNLENSMGAAIYTMDYVDPISGKRIVGYLLEKTHG